MTTAAIYPKLLDDKYWQKSSLAFSKPYIYGDANATIIGYIENNIAHIAKVNIQQPEILQPIATLERALDISVCFDARWSYQNGLYKYYTIGEPYIATIDAGNKLYIRYGVGGVPEVLASGVSEVMLVRGWKHTSILTDDQGLCAIYLKEYFLYSKEYVQSADGSFGWTAETRIDIPLPSIKNFTAYRTTDYRIVIIASDGKQAYTCASTRMWPGTAIKHEVLSYSTKMESKVTFKPIATIEGYLAETIGYKTRQSSFTSDYMYNQPQRSTAINTDGYNIYLGLTNMPVSYDLANNLRYLSIKDSTGMPFGIVSIEYGFPYLHLEMLDFNNAIGDVTIKYEYGWSKPDSTEIEAFEVTFTPINLVPEVPDPPVITTIINVDTEVITSGS